MKLSTLKEVCAAFHQKSTGDLTIGSTDMFLVAANNARRSAELLHNFEYSRLTALLSIDGVSGASLASAVIDGDSGIPRTLTVTGTLTPDVTGSYAELGVTAGADNFEVYFSTSTRYFVGQLDDGTRLLGNNFPLADSTIFWVKAAPGIAGTYTAGAGAGATGTATIVAGTSSLWNGIKEVVAVSRMRPDGTWIPLDFARVDIPIERDRTELEFSDNLFPYLRYPSDAQINARGTNSSIVQRGTSLYIHPRFNNVASSAFQVQLEAFGWLNDYDASSLLFTTEADFLQRYGSAYLQWAIICELNYIFQTYVPRTEGSTSAPEQAKADEWQKLLLWDSYIVDSNTTRSR